LQVYGIETVNECVVVILLSTEQCDIKSIKCSSTTTHTGSARSALSVTVY